jgi:hypothetical protein
VAPDGLAGGLGALVIAGRSVDQLAQDIDVPGVRSLTGVKAAGRLRHPSGRVTSGALG